MMYLMKTCLLAVMLSEALVNGLDESTSGTHQTCPTAEHDNCCSCLSDEGGGTPNGDWDSGNCCGHCTDMCGSGTSGATTTDKEATATDKEATATDKDAATKVKTVSASIKVKGIKEDDLVKDKATQEAITKGFAEAAKLDAKTVKIVKIGDTSIARRLVDGALVITFEIQATGSKTADAILKIIQSTTAEDFSTKVSEHASAITVAAKGPAAVVDKGTETFSAASTSVTSTVTAVTSAVVVAVLMM